MTTYRAKELKTVEAVQWTGDSERPMPDWFTEALREGHLVTRQNHDEGVLELRMTTAQHQWVYAKPGEWIVREGVADRFYPIADDIFRATYEVAE